MHRGREASAASDEPFEPELPARTKSFLQPGHWSTYRIAETIRVLLIMTLSILVFNFYPVTAVMIVLLALLDDGAIISIAFDRARGSGEPVSWSGRRSIISCHARRGPRAEGPVGPLQQRQVFPSLPS